MNKEEIFNQYAIKQGYDDFNHLILDDMFEGNLDNTMETINAVTDLIQDELLKKASKQLILGQTLNKAQQAILKTEIL